MTTLTLKFPTLGFIVMTRAALGAGIGLLAANRLTKRQRHNAGLALVAIGAATTVPAVLAIMKARTER